MIGPIFRLQLPRVCCMDNKNWGAVSAKGIPEIGHLKMNKQQTAETARSCEQRIRGNPREESDIRDKNGSTPCSKAVPMLLLWSCIVKLCDLELVL